MFNSRKMWKFVSYYIWGEKKQGLGRTEPVGGKKEKIDVSLAELKDALKKRGLKDKSTETWESDHPFWVFERLILTDLLRHYWCKEKRSFTKGDFLTQHRNRIRVNTIIALLTKK